MPAFKSQYTVVTVDLAGGAVSTDDGLELAFSMKPGARDALREGRWDPIGLLLEHKEQIRAVAASYALFGSSPANSGAVSSVRRIAETRASSSCDARSPSSRAASAARIDDPRSHALVLG